MSDTPPIVTGKIVKPRILLVGIGGMGLYTLRSMEGSVDFAQRVAVDTDGPALERSLVPEKVQIGVSFTDGQSTGGDADTARRSATHDFATLRAYFVHADIVIFLAGLGGGVGSGAVPVLAEMARDEACTVMTMVSTPFEFEGPDRAAVAAAALAQLRTTDVPVVVMPNQDLLEDESAASTPIDQMLRRAAERMGSGFRVLWRLLEGRNLINLDFVHLRNVLAHSGKRCHFVYVEGGGPGKVKLVLGRLEHHPALQREKAMEESEGLLIGVLGGDDITLREVQDVLAGVYGLVQTNVRRVVGVGVDPALRSRVGVLLLAGSAPVKSAQVVEDVPRPPRMVAPLEGKTAEPRPIKGRRLVTAASVQAERKRQRPSAPDQGEEARAEAARSAVSQPPAQEELPLAPVAKGRFQGVEPTLHQGEDLDIPTFFRRGMRLSRNAG